MNNYQPPSFWKIVSLVLFVALIILGLIFIISARRAENREAQLTSTISTNQKVVDFTALFIEQVLKTESEVSFEKRLALENAVRALNDTQILAGWQAFVDSSDAKTAQTAVVNLLSLLVSKFKL